MTKITRAARTAQFINENSHLNMNECCLAMVENGMFRNNTEARDWFRYCVRQGHAQGEIVKGPRVTVKSTGANRFSVTVKQQEANEQAMAAAQATMGEPTEEDDGFEPPKFLAKEAEGYDPTAPETLKQRKARQARERRAAKKAK
jgi:hypothetical protein